MKYLALALALSLLVSLSGCALLPEEEVFASAPITRSYEAETYELSYVERGDIVLSKKVSCTYVPVQTEALKFAVGGEYIDEIYVSVGDSVEAGQLLGQLRLGTLETRLEACEKELAALKLALDQLDANLALDAKELEIRLADDKAALSEALKKLNESYDATRQSYDDSLYIQSIRLAELKDDIAKRQMRPSFAGTVTYVRKVNDGDRSVEGERMISVADSTLSLFRAETDLWTHFNEGDEYVIISGKAEYPARVAGAESLGIAPQKKEADERAYVYFVLNDPTFDLEDGDKGTFTLTLDSRSNVLTVPKSAVTTANGESIVYYQNEQGVKSYKTIVTGLEADGRVEIISGLSEGDSVITG